MKIKEEIKVKLRNPRAAKALYDAIYTEMKSPAINERSKIINVRLKETDVFIEIEATDLTALRASTDSKLRWISVIGESLETVEKVKNQVKNF